jgi:hypothetical protein
VAGCHAHIAKQGEHDSIRNPGIGMLVLLRRDKHGTRPLADDIVTPKQIASAVGRAASVADLPPR